MVFVRTTPKLPSLLRPIEIVAIIFGAAIISLPQRKPLIYLCISYTALQLVLSIVLSIYRIGYIQPRFCQPNPVSQSVNGIQQLLGLTVVIAVYYQTLFRKSDVRKILKLLAKSHHDLLQLNITMKHRVFGIKIIVEVTLVLVYVFSAFVVCAIHYDVTTFDALALEYFSAISPLVLTNLALMMFINICWHIRNELELLRKMLEEIVRCEGNEETKGDGIWMTRTCNGASQLLFHRVQRVAKIYETLFDATRLLNKIFGLSNLTSIGWVQLAAENCLQIDDISFFLPLKPF